MNALDLITATVEPSHAGAALQALLKRLGFQQATGYSIEGSTEFGLHRFYVQRGVWSYAVRASIFTRSDNKAPGYQVEFFGYYCSTGATTSLTESAACQLVRTAVACAQEVLDAPDTKTAVKLAKAAARRMHIKMSYHLDGVAERAAQLRESPA